MHAWVTDLIKSRQRLVLMSPLQKDAIINSQFFTNFSKSNNTKMFPWEACAECRMDLSHSLTKCHKQHTLPRSWLLLTGLSPLNAGLQLCPLKRFLHAHHFPYSGWQWWVWGYSHYSFTNCFPPIPLVLVVTFNTFCIPTASCFSCSRDWSPDLPHAKQALYHWAVSPASLLLVLEV